MRDSDIIDRDADVLGAIENILGAVQAVPALPGRAAPGAVQFRGMNIRQAPALLSDLPAGVSSGPTGKLLPVPFNAAVFTTAAVGALTARPQIPVRGHRLIMVATPFGVDPGTPALAAGALVTSITVGQGNVFCNAGAVPVAAFANVSVSVTMLWPTAQPGIDIVINVALAGVPAVGDSVTVSAVLLAEAVS